MYAADRWIVLDDVQFARRDYQHRARLADLDEPARQQWLALPTHLPQGRSTLISQARLVDARRSRRTVHLLVRQYYGRSPHWKAMSNVLDAVLDTLVRHTGHTLSTRSGATLKDTMVRAGQSSEKAALIYQHSDEERQRDVAAGLDEMVRAERAKHHKDNPAHHSEESTGS
ncbi:WbqC family protein [Streptomyces sp. TRM72054]|uniref:WbqC family protein n=1 Tax=Streptomyces sp. TRM72054 TaxID=2870562 RepID=UPI0035AB9324